MEFNITIN